MAKVILTAKSSAMKSYLPLLTFAVLLTSCSSVYKSGQTPDDVYFSPARPQEDEYVQVEKKNDRMYHSQNYDYTLEDQYLRMKVRNRRYAFLDDDPDYYYGSNYNSYYNYYRLNSYYGGYYNPALWSLNFGFGNYYSPYYYSPYYYNPYYANPYYNGIVYGNVSPVYNKPRTTNLNIYDGNGNMYNPNRGKSYGRTFSNSSGNEGNYRGSGTNAGGFLRNVFGSGNNNSSSTNSAQPSSSNSGSSGSSSSGSSHAPVRRF
jgi:hypothetical protein